MKKILLFLFLPVLMIWITALGSSIEDTLSSIENLTFNRVYSNDDLSSRLTRLETEIFGAKQSGNLETRVDKLLKNAYYCENPSYDDYGAIVSTNSGLNNKQGGIKGILSKLKNEFSDGNITGYTPPVTTNYGINSYDFGSSSIYSPFSDPFFTNKFNRPFDNYRYNSPIPTGTNVYKRTNPFQKSTLGVSDKKYLKRHYRARTIPNGYTTYRPINTNTSIGTRVHILK